MKVYINVKPQNWSSCRNMFCPLEKKMEIDILWLNQFLGIEGDICEPVKWLEWKQPWKQPTMASCWINFLPKYQKTKVQKTCNNNNFKQ